MLKNTTVNPGTMKRGCNHPQAPADGSLRDANDDAVANDYLDVAGKIVVVQRGTCARIARAIYGQAEGAAGVIMVNNSTALPPFEGPITTNPDTGVPVPGGVTIPFLGVRGLVAAARTDGNRLLNLDGTMISFTANNLAERRVQGLLVVLVRRASPGRLDPQARRHGARREHPLDRRRLR